VSLEQLSFEDYAGNYIDPFSILAAIDFFYPSQAANTTLVIRLFGTPGPRLKDELRKRNW